MKWFGDIAKLYSMQDFESLRPMPTGYGISYFRRDTLHLVLYPIPFNFVARFLRRCWMSLCKKSDQLSRDDLIILNAYETGYHNCQEWHRQNVEVINKRNAQLFDDLIRAKIKEERKKL